MTEKLLLWYTQRFWLSCPQRELATVSRLQCAGKDLCPSTIVGSFILIVNPLYRSTNHSHQSFSCHVTESQRFVPHATTLLSISRPTTLTFSK